MTLWPIHRQVVDAILVALVMPALFSREGEETPFHRSHHPFRHEQTISHEVPRCAGLEPSCLQPLLVAVARSLTGTVAHHAAPELSYSQLDNMLWQRYLERTSFRGSTRTAVRCSPVGSLFVHERARG